MLVLPKNFILSHILPAESISRKLAGALAVSQQQVL